MTSRRDRYNNANIRGGLGVRKRLSEESLRDTYRLNGVQTGSVVARAHDKYFADFTKGYDLGVLVRKTASTVYIHWYGEEDMTTYSQGDARYEVDRGRWKFLGILQGNPLDPSDPLVDALTKLRENARMLASAHAGTPPTEETEEMAREMSNAAAERAAAKKALSNGDLKDRDTYTAKQVAARCGTDSKTMRKFFRSSHSTVEPVGQGGRYEFDAKDMPKIKSEFAAWRKKAKARQTTPKPIEKTVESMADAIQKSVNTDDYPTPKVPEGFGGIDRYGPNDPDVLPSFEVLDDEPTEEELAALEDGELDLDED